MNRLRVFQILVVCSALLLLGACAAGDDTQAQVGADSTATTTDTSGVVAANGERKDTKTQDPRGSRATDATGKPTGVTSRDTTAKATTLLRPDDTFELVEDAKSNFYTLPTFANDIDDMNVRLDDLQPWDAKLTDYLGTYYGSLDSEVNGVRVLGAGRGQVTLIFSYGAEVAKDNGEITYEEGEKAFAGLTLYKTTVTWGPVQPVYTSQGQFVTWQSAGKTYFGMLTKGTNTQGKPPFALFRLSAS